MKTYRILVLVAALTAGHAQAADASQKPNILVILSDDQGYADAGFQGSKEIPTPHLDRLAREGLRCTSGYVTHSFCSPSRAALMTGCYQMRFGHENNPYYDPTNHREGLPTTEKLLPQYLREAGYATGWIGKWHLGAAPEFWPEKRGFQETFGFIGGGHIFQNWKVNPAVEYNVPICRNGKPVAVKEHLTLAFGHEAAAFVKRHKTKPWFLYLAFNAPHTPHQPTAERLAKFSHIKNMDRRKYAAQVSLMDDAIGEALTAIRNTGQSARTLVFFFSDNGGPTHVGANNGSLRGMKGTTYEGGVRVPFVVSWPDKLPAGKDYAQTVSSLDVFATALACAGVPMPTDKPYDGVNLIPYLSGANPGNPHDQLFWRQGSGQWGVRAGTMKLVRQTSELVIVTEKGHPKYKTVPLPQASDQLYDLANDIGETRNLAAAQAGKVKSLKAQLADWEKQATPPAFTGVQRKEPKPKPQTRRKTTTLPPPSELPRPTAAQIVWQEAELGVMFSYDERVFLKKHGDHIYDKLDPQIFNPTRLDMNQWAATVKDLGGTFAYYTTSHETGFRFWQSDANPNCLKNIRWRNGKADLVREFVDACRKHNIKPGLFLSAHSLTNLRIKDHKPGKGASITLAEYNRMQERELEELCTRYGEIFKFWWDRGVLTPDAGGPDVMPIIMKHQPQAIFYHSQQRSDVRWAGSESGTVSYPCWSTITPGSHVTRKLLGTGEPDGSNWRPALADTPLRCQGKHIWFFQHGTEQNVAPLKVLQQMYYNSVGRNATLVIGIAPDPDGLVPAPDVARCKEFGDWIRKTFGGKPLAETSGKGAELTLDLPANAQGPVRHIILQEEIANGERVRKYVIEAMIDGVWMKIGAGSCIGHKRIEKIAPCNARQYRLRVTKSVAEPEIKSFNVR